MASSGFKRAVSEERKKLTRADFEAFQKETPEVKAKRYEDRAAATSDPQLKEHYLSIAKHQREIEAIQAVGGFAADEARERALELGPTTWQKIGWKLNNLSNYLRAYLPKDVVKISSNCLAICAPILIFTILIKSAIFDLGLNIALSVLISSALYLIAVIEYQNKVFSLTASLLGLCVALQLYNLFGQCIAPQRGYIGIHESNGQVVGLINTSRESWMPSPGFFDTITWYEGIPFEFFAERNIQLGFDPNHRLARDNIVFETLIYKRTEISFGDKTKLVVSARKTLNPEGLKKIHPAAKGQNLGPYMMDIHRRFDEVVNASIPKEGEAMDLEALKAKIAKIENDVWKIDEVHAAILQK